MYKLQPLTPMSSKRKAFIRFSSIVMPSSRKTKPFIQRVAKELDTINNIAVSSAKRSINRTVGGGVNIESSNTVFKKRDYIHQIAYKAIPYK